MGLKRPSRQAVDSALKAHYDSPGRPFSKLTDAGLIHEIYEAFREGIATGVGMKLTERLRTAILTAELRVGQNEMKRANTARKRMEKRDARRIEGGAIDSPQTRKRSGGKPSPAKA